MSIITPPRPDRRAPPSSEAEPPRASWRWWEGLLVYFIGLVVASLLFILFGWTEPAGDTLVFASVVEAVTSTVVLVLWLWRAHAGWIAVIGVPARPWREARTGFGFGLILYPGIAFGVALTLGVLLHALSGHTVTTPDQVPSRLSALGNAVFVFYAIVVAPVREEFLFRGILFNPLRDRLGFGGGALAAGVLFGLAHYVPGAAGLRNVMLITTMVFTGFALAFLYARRGNILASIVAHATFNLIGIASVFLLH